ncbi:MAG: pyrroline-5-carboxylate reductase [Planctomycetes bacterium]|nr:pyrroline-5-carboxylate reductase [Planctomycetota bacterium]
MQEQPIGFVGTGQMAVALAQGFVRAGLYVPERILGYDPDLAARQRFSAAVPGAALAEGNGDLVRQAGVVVLAVKPHHLPEVAAEVRRGLSGSQLVISVAAGVTLGRLEAMMGTPRVVRVMPNTPCLVGQGASAYAMGPGTTDGDAAMVQALLSAVGLAYPLEERYLDAVTGLSGSGPAFVYVLIEALSDGGVSAGLPRPIASALAAQTVRGAAEMVLVLGEHPAVLKERVASPGGTTMAGLQALEAHGLRAAAMAAVVAAANRAREMGREAQ